MFPILKDSETNAFNGILSELARAKNNPDFTEVHMAQLKYKDRIYNKTPEISNLMKLEGLIYERWELSDTSNRPDEDILDIYHADIQQISKRMGYQSADLVALSEKTPKLDEIIAKFSKEHHHLEDEVRFTVEGEGVFVIKGIHGDFLEFKAEPADLIVIPAKRRHFFTLTPKKYIRTIRLFKNLQGWEAIYDENR